MWNLKNNSKKIKNMPFHIMFCEYPTLPVNGWNRRAEGLENQVIFVKGEAGMPSYV